jgi:hypothetical protein
MHDRIESRCFWLTLIAVVGAFVLSACVPFASAPSSSDSRTSSPSETPSPVLSAGTATSTPSATPGTVKRTPTPVPAERPSDLVVRLEVSGDTCCPVPWAVVTADGRFVTRTDDQQLRERRLTPAGAQRIRDELISSGLFDRDQRFPLVLRPGASGPQRGVGGLSFKIWRDTRTVEVQTAYDQGPDEVLFEPSAARTRLDRLSKQLMHPETWLPADAWVDPIPRAYEARAFALLLRREVAQSNEMPTIETLTVTWPFSVGPLALGDTMPASAGPQAESTRCLVLTKDDMLVVRTAMVRAAGADAVYTLPDGAFLAGFAAEDHGSRLIVSVRLLPPDRASCSGEYVQ